MIALIQRVSEASVHVNEKVVGSIDKGVLALIGVERGDTEKEADRLLQRLLAYRIFPDDNGRMNLDVHQAGGGLLLVPQFTLAADTDSGNRPGFSPAAAPQEGARLFRYFTGQARSALEPVAMGEFGADMKVHLVNDGPVTFWLQVPPGL
ncbi:MAG: D-aminoacyl-tRNA deacylase [Xanthomonadales bacterium]|nr:D-aminoacyl-tRNA deacylase [Xanthomonadales bacterium]